MERIFCLILWQEATEGDQTHTNTPPPSTIVPSGGLCTPLMLDNCVVDQNHNLKINVPHSLMNEEVSEMCI